ncbi:hypothetical protein MUN76_10220 [Leucobacter rhizosphaerae]|uniref:Multidrug transporter n=1 Tax=Leucobacter rhizosphaerae TaxID=2932245 RepID=A0ABY4FT38_9MICO|nr:hypothetical protein [Leucobacter rhizosphaerae]UOQ59427.1 hypothetical protein MUN76_10220 [Leucobacter rhizosphaerae]
MSDTGVPNEEIDEDHELVETAHRDQEHAVDPEHEPDTETAGLSPAEALEELGEDVSSSPAQRGRPEVSGS